jgi:hypothetical protein
MPSSNHGFFEKWFLTDDSLVAEWRQVERLEGAVNDQLRHGAPDSRRLLRTVTGKSVGEHEVRHVRVEADDQRSLAD